MSGYKLFYFPVRGGGEKCRLAFGAAKIDYEDIRLPAEEWAKEKAWKLTIGDLSSEQLLHDFDEAHMAFAQVWSNNRENLMSLGWRNPISEMS
ncbi:unnamed protein product [Porites evermanni]|uniref:GST N-terminal domain-containing protein n=1 Tax=Porites evermanni TaxID=104178 RepID=A0ABN8T1P6_9CNID|nr:unnamed protein product [Porites evermanni]